MDSTLNKKSTAGVSALRGRSRASPSPEGWVLFAAILASTMAFINQSALNVALPAIQSSLAAHGSELLWIINAYTLMLASFILVGGSLGDKLGRKRIFMLGIGLFILASLVCGLAPSVRFLIGARIVQGVGGALMVPGSLALISAAYSPDRRGRAIGTWSAVTTITTVAGPVIGGFLAEAGIWRVVFFMSALVGLTDGPQDYWKTFLPSIVVFGIGMGFTVAPLTTTVMTSVDTKFADTASGINNATSRVAGVLAIAAAVFIRKKPVKGT